MTPEVDDLKFDVERLEKAVDVLAASVNAATIRAETAEGEAERLRAQQGRKAKTCPHCGGAL